MPTTDQLAAYLLESRPDRDCWSIAECRQPASKLAELKVWAFQLTSDRFRHELKLNAHKLGLVLLWLESEVLRRQRVDTAVWAILANPNIVNLRKDVHAILFAGGQATQLHRELLRESALHYGLRNTFDESDAHNWYRLFYLQFAISHWDVQTHLADWLTNPQNTISVERLLAAKDSGALDFAHMWHSLRMYRRANLPQSVMEQRLRDSCWVLPDWHREVLSAAKARSASGLTPEDEAARDISFVTQPRLEWDARQKPVFLVQLCNLTDRGLDQPEYQVQTGDLVLARLIRQADETYASDMPDDLRLPPSPEVGISLSSTTRSHEELVAEQTLVSLWDSTQEVTLYSARTGLRYAPDDQPREGAELFAIAAGDLAMQPVPGASADLGLGYTVHRIARGWKGILVAKLDDDVVWSSGTRAKAGSTEIPGLHVVFPTDLDLTSTSLNKVPAPWPLAIRIQIPSGWTFRRMKWRRSDGTLEEFSSLPTELRVMERDVVSPVVLRLQITDGQEVRSHVLRIFVPVRAIMKWDRRGEPHLHRPVQHVLCDEASNLRWSFHVPVAPHFPRDLREYNFVEGHRLLARVKPRPAPILDLAGYGAPLFIQADPFHPKSPVLQVSRSVINAGQLGKIYTDADDIVHMRTRLAAPEAEHSLFAWVAQEEGDSAVVEVPPSTIIPSEGEWVLPSLSRVRLYALALFYRGEWLGASFRPFTWVNAVAYAPPGNLEQTAALLRVWKAPLLRREEGQFRLLCHWIGENLTKVLPVWLSNGPLQMPGGFNATNRPSVEWLDAVRDLLQNVQPNPTLSEIESLMHAVAPGEEELEAFGRTFMAVLDAEPGLAVRMARTYFAQPNLNTSRKPFIKKVKLLFGCRTDLDYSDNLGRKHGNKDGFWLRSTVPSLDATDPGPFSYAHHVLSSLKDYRDYCLAIWLDEIDR